MSQAATSMPSGTQTIGGQNVHWGQMLPKRHNRKSLKMALTVAGVAMGGLAMIGGIIPGGATPMLAASHAIDRMKNGITETDELKSRAEFYSKQIFTTLGLQPKPGQLASLEQFKEAAGKNPELAKLYNAPVHERKKENRFSMMTNGAIGAASLLPGAGVVAGLGNMAHHAAEAVKIGGEATKVANYVKTGVQAAALIGRDVVAGMAGGALAKALSKDELDPHALVEAMQEAAIDAPAHGMSIADVVTPEMVFAVRVAQDEAFAEAIRKDARFGKVPFHKMDVETQRKVMLEFPALADAATTEATAVVQSQNPTTVAELGASKPDLSGQVARYKFGAQGTSFVGRELARRDAANDARNPSSNVRSMGGHAARLEASRAQAMQAVGGRKV